MADWAKRNFEDMDDRSPAEVPMRWLFSRGVVRSTETGVSRFSYEPGARMPFGHRHKTQEEVYVVVAGSGRAKLADEIVDLGLWDVVRVAPQVIRSFEAGPDGMELICVGGRRQARRRRTLRRLLARGRVTAPIRTACTDPPTWTPWCARWPT